MRTLLGVFMFGGRTKCWWSGQHRFVESVLGYEPSFNGEHTWITVHVNCLRCPKSYRTSRKCARRAAA